MNKAIRLITFGSQNPIVCPTGSYCPTGMAISTPCSIGNYCPTTIQQLPCPSGNYCPTTSMTSATPCPTGSYCPTIGMTSSIPCSIGNYWPTTIQQLPCPSGNYCPTTSMTSSTPCPTGSYCPTIGMTSATPCPTGSYCPNTGMTSATPCPIGNYCPTTSMTSATPCPIGNYCPTTGMTSATPCPIGSYCPTTIQQLPCPIGSYCPTTSMTSATPCPTGSYCPTTGMTSAAPCPIGSYCPSTIQQIPCPSGYYCPNNGSQNPIVCPAGSYCPSMNMYTIAGGTFGFKNGYGIDAQFYVPSGIAVDNNGTIYVSDSVNHIIRQITNGNVSTYAGTYKSNRYSDGLINGQKLSSSFKNPAGIAIYNGTIYIADSGNYSIRKIDTSGNVSTLAGTGAFNSNYNFSNGPGSSAQFNTPQGIAVDTIGNVYVTDIGTSIIRKIDTNGYVSILAGRIFSKPYGIHGSDLGPIPGDTDGPGSSAQFYTPQGIAVDTSGNVYVADTGNNKIRKIDTFGNVSTIYSITNPTGIAVDKFGNLYVTDNGTDKAVVKIEPSGGISKCLIGNFINGIAVDNSGSIYVTDVNYSSNTSFIKIVSGSILPITCPAGKTSQSGSTSCT